VIVDSKGWQLVLRIAARLWVSGRRGDPGTWLKWLLLGEEEKLGPTGGLVARTFLPRFEAI